MKKMYIVSPVKSGKRVNYMSKTLVLNPWVTTPLEVGQTFHRGRLRLLENTDKYYYDS